MKAVLRYVVVLSLLLLAAPAAAAQYEGEGGLIEAYGSIWASWYQGHRVVELCRTYPALVTETDAVKKGFNGRNLALFQRIGQRMDELAVQQGGEKERQRFHDEMEAARPALHQESTVQLQKLTKTEAACRQLLRDVNAGKWDLRTRFAHQVTQILGSDQGMPSAAFVRGVMEGCIDGQKRRLRADGVPYEGQEERVRQYCACMTPMSVELLNTPEGRAKALDGDEVLKERARKLEAICVDGVNNGRKFAPNDGSP